MTQAGEATGILAASFLAEHQFSGGDMNRLHHLTHRQQVLAALVALTLAGCAPTRGNAPEPGADVSQPPRRSLVIAVQVEPLFVVGKGLRHAGNSQSMTVGMFNAGLAYQD